MNSRQISTLTFTLASFSLLGHIQAKKANEPKPPKDPILSERKKALSAAEQLKAFKVPEGFVVELVASEENGLVNPIDLSFDDAGRLWTQTARMYPMDPVGDMSWNDLKKIMKKDPKKVQASMPEYVRIKKFYTLETKGEDKVLVIDNPTQQVKGQIRAFATGLSIPQSILPYKDGVFVAHGSEMLYFADEDKDGVSDKHYNILTGFGFNDSHTMSHTLVRGPGGWIHFSQGALNQGEITAVISGETEEISYSKIARFSLDGKHVQVRNNGLNNIWGFHLKANGQWYGTEANDFGASLVPMHPMMGYKGIGNKKLRSYQPLAPMMHKFRVGGTGISGLAYDENGSRGFPDKWKNMGFLANPITNTINCVIADRNADGSAVSEHLEDFLHCEDDWFRPVNIEFGPDGCLYIVDWYNKVISHNEIPRSHPDRDKNHGRIWRVRHESQKPSAVPNLMKVKTSELVQHLTSEILWEKRAAWHQIVDRNATETSNALISLVSDTAQSSATRIHALWSLEGLKAFDEKAIRDLLKDKDPDLRREAVRSLIHFDPDLSLIVEMLTPMIKDDHYMVKEQVLRTLAEIKKANAASIELLVSACQPEAKGSNFGGPYEIKFQRFLIRKALENYPDELLAFLETPAGKGISADTAAWVSEAVSQDKKGGLFLAQWNKGPKTLDLKTLVSVTPILKNPKVAKALAPKLATAEALNLALEAQSMLDSSKLVAALTPGLKKLIKSSSPEDQALAIKVANSYQSPSILAEVAALVKESPADQISLGMLNVLAIDLKKSKVVISELAQKTGFNDDTQRKVISLLAQVSPAEANLLAAKMMDGKSDQELTAIISQLSYSSHGSSILLGLVKDKKLAPKMFDASSAERVISAHPKHKMAGSLRKLAAAQTAKENQSAAGRIEDYVKAVGELKGNPVIGSAIFQSCLGCHQVGEDGYDFAPALDGSGLRDLEHLMTAIVKPNAAIESGYQRYRITKTNGDILEGYMFESNAYGTTIASMGGLKVFVPKPQISKGAFVTGRSFMPDSFGKLPTQTMVDLISHIKTLK